MKKTDEFLQGLRSAITDTTSLNPYNHGSERQRQWSHGYHYGTNQLDQFKTRLYAESEQEVRQQETAESKLSRLSKDMLDVTDRAIYMLEIGQNPLLIFSAHLTREARRLNVTYANHRLLKMFRETMSALTPDNPDRCIILLKELRQKILMVK